MGIPARLGTSSPTSMLRPLTMHLGIRSEEKDNHDWVATTCCLLSRDYTIRVSYDAWLGSRALVSETAQNSASARGQKE